jgi:hypothetical protein
MGMILMRLQPLLLVSSSKFCYCMLTATAKDILREDDRLLRIKITLYHCHSDTGILAVRKEHGRRLLNQEL